jgi:tetratricopeptide (TPR) repeat protein
MKGVALWEQGEVAASQAALDRARELDYRLPDRDKVLLKTMSYRMNGELDKLEKLLRMQTQVQDNADAYQQLAYFLMLAGRLDEARDTYLGVLERDRNNPAPFIQLAQIERTLGDLDAAIGFADRYVTARPDDTKGHTLLGNLQVEAGEMERARESYAQAALLEDPPVTATLKLAQLSIRQGDWQDARQHLEEARELALTDQQAIQILAVEQLLEVRLGRIERAMELARDQDSFNASVLSPLDRVFNQNLPLIIYNMKLGRLEQAESLLSRAEQSLQPPMDQFLAFPEAILAARQNDFERAEMALQSGQNVIEQFKAEYLAYQVPLVRGEVERIRGNYAEAADLYVEAVEKSRRSVLLKNLSNELSQLYAMCAQMHVKAGDLDLAQAALDRAFRADEAEPQLWVARAMLQHARGNRPMANASIQYALAIWSDADPEYAEYRDSLELARMLAD